MAKEIFTDEQVDAEIERLRNSPYVKLALRLLVIWFRSLEKKMDAARSL